VISLAAAASPREKGKRVGDAVVPFPGEKIRDAEVVAASGPITVSIRNGILQGSAPWTGRWQ